MKMAVHIRHRWRMIREGPESMPRIRNGPFGQANLNGSASVRIRSASAWKVSSKSAQFFT